MIKKSICLFSAVLLNAMPITQGRAGDALTVGVRGGINGGDLDEDFERYELFASYGLPWRWQWGAGWSLGVKIDASMGALRGADTTAFIAMLGPGLGLGVEGLPLVLDLGVAPTFISEDQFGDENLGGEIQFSSHIGLSYLLEGGLTLGYRFQHTSNASIKDPNPGLNMHLFQLGYRF